MVSVVNSNKDIVIDSDANIIFKYGNYTNTYINIDIAGIPNDVILNLVDENDEVLFSPFDLDGNYVRSQCFVRTTGGKHIIQLPANYNNNDDYLIWEDFPAGQYQWSLYFAGNDSYESIRIPLNVEIRDFKIWDIQTPEIYPYDDVKVKLKTYGDTYYPADSAYLSNFLYNNNITYDDSTGIITYPNVMLADNSLGKYSRVVNEVTRHTINYEILNPIEFYYTGTQLYESERRIGYEIKKKSMFPNPVLGTNDKIFINNSEGMSANGSYLNIVAGTDPIVANKYNGYRFPPGIYNCVVWPKDDAFDNKPYVCEGSFEVSTQGCDLTLDFSVPESEYKEDMTGLTNSSLQISGSNAMMSKVDNKLHISNASFSYTHPDKFNEVLLTFSSGSFIPDQIYVRGEHIEINNMPNYSKQANTDTTIKIYFCDYSSLYISPSDSEGNIIIEYNDDTTLLDWSPTEAASYEDNNISFTVSGEEVILSDFSVRQTNILSGKHPTTELVSNYIYNNNHPISDATITLINMKNNSKIETKVTDENGQCRWTVENSGKYKAVATNINNEELLSSNEQKVRTIKYVTNNEELLNAYNTVEDGDIIFIKSGTYSLNDLPTNMSYPSCEIIGDSPKPVIKNTSSTDRFFRTKDDSSVLKVSNLYFENTSRVIGITNEIDSDNDGGRIEVYNCDWVGARKQYNWYAISTRIGNVLVDSCTFIDNKTTDYGHFCTAIMAHKNSSFSDITVKRCTFDGNINSGNVHKGNAAAIITSTYAFTGGSYAIAQLNNVHFYCNTYVKSGDTLYGIEEGSCVRYVELTSDKTILSYKDEDSCILSAFVTNIDNDAVPNQSVDFCINNVLIGTGFTNENGVATCTYESTGAGEIEFIASCRDIVSETYSIEDCKWANDGSKNTNFNIGTNALVTTDGEYVTIAQSGSGERYVTIPFEALSTDNFEFECIVDYDNSVTNAFTFAVFNQNSFTVYDNKYVNYSNSAKYFYNRICSAGSTPSFNLEDGDKITLKRQNEQWELLVNDVQVFSCPLSWDGVKTFGFYSGSGRKQVFKDLKIKLLKLSSSVSVDNTTFNILAPDTLSITGTVSVPNATVKLMEGTTQLSTTTADSTGAFTITSTGFTVGTHTVKVVYGGDETYSMSGSQNITVNVRNIERVLLTGNKSVLSYYDEETCTLSASVLDGNDEGIGGELVNFYAGNTLLGSSNTDNNGVATYIYESAGTGDVEFTASCRNIVSETYVVQDYLFNPPLDGTDAITSWTSMTNKTEDGIYYSHGSFLTDGWSNEELWQLDFDVCSPNWRYVGLMPVCSEEIKPYTGAKSKNYAMTSWEGLAYFGGLDHTVISEITMSKITSLNTWHHVTIQKLNDIYCKIIINNTYESIRRYNNLQNLSELHLGTRDNAYGRNEGGIIQFKNIKVAIKEQKDLSSGIKVDSTIFNILAPDTLSITGTVSVPNATVKLMEDNTQLGTATSDNNGNFTITGISFTAGTHTVKVVYDGDAIYNASQSPNITVNVKNISSVSLTGDKQILSYYDNDKCTLSATVLDGNGEGISGTSVNFYANNTLLGSSNTNNNGVATYNYNSADSGNIEFIASCRNIASETYEIKDVDFYDSCGLDKTSNYTPCVVEGGNYRSLIFNTDHYEFGLSSNANTAFVLNNFEVPTDCIIEYDVLQKNSSGSAAGIGFAHTTATNKASFNGGVFFWDSMSWYNYINQRWTTTNWSNQKYIDNKSILNKWVHITLEKHDYTITINAYDDEGNIYFSDLIRVINTNLRNIPLEMALFGFNSNNQIKNIKIKTLYNVASVSLTGDKSILSYYDEETCILSATVLDENGDEVRGEQVNFYADEALLGSSYTNNNGVAIYNYTSTGAGDIEFTASVGDIVSEIYVVEDCVYANDGSNVNGLTAQSGVSVTSDGEWVSISTSTSGEKYVITPTSFSSSDNFEFECKINKTNSNFHAIAFVMLNENNFSVFNNVYMNYDVSTNRFNLRLIGNSGSVTNVSRTLSDGDTITIQRRNETWIVLHNDEQIHTIAYSWTGNKTLGFYTNKDKKQLLKDLKIKALPNVASVSLTGNKEILSYYDGDECTLSATVLNEKGKKADGESVDFYANNILLGSSSTDNTGVATYNYISTGEGDTKFTASVGNIVSEIYELEDCYIFNDLTDQSQVESLWNVPSNVKNRTYGFSSDGWTIGDVSSYTGIPNIFSLPDLPYSVSFKINQLTTVGLVYKILQSSLYLSSGSDGKIGVISRPISWVLGHTYTLKIYSDKVELYDEDTLVQTYSTSITGDTIAQWDTGSSRILTVKDFKIKVLPNITSV